MKSIVIFDELNEVDLKPTGLLEEYVKLVEKDVHDILIKRKNLKKCNCPACSSPESVSAFVRFGLNYVECADCRTLYISPRPDDGALNRYYTQSRAMAFWRDELSKMTRKKRREKIIKPRFQWISESTEEYLPDAQNLADINTNQYGYIEEMKGAKLFRRKILINPYLKLEPIELDKDISIINTPWWNVSLEEKLDVVCLFEIADRTSDIDLLFTKIKELLKEGGLLFMTAILISGFDTQILWEHAENIYPPDRLNVFSIEGLRALFRRHNFECLELSTPGVLDVEIVTKAVCENSEIKLPRFLGYMLHSRSEDTRRSFQAFLQASLLSSYGRILVRRR